MDRLKLPLFMVISAALAGGSLFGLTRLMSSWSSSQMTEKLAWGQALFETSNRLAQSYRTTALAVAAASPGIVEVSSAMGDEAPKLSVAEPVRKSIHTAFERLPAGLRRAEIFLFGNSKGVVLIPSAEGEATTRDDPDTFRLTTAGRSGPVGAFALVDGKLYQVAAVPLRVVETEGEKAIGWLGAAFPLDDEYAAEQAKDLTLPVTLVVKKPIATSLPKGSAIAINEGPAAPQNPPKHGPFLTGVPLAMAKTFPIDGIDGGRVVLVAESATLPLLADMQIRGLLFLGALLALGFALQVFARTPKTSPAAVTRFDKGASGSKSVPPPFSPATARTEQFRLEDLKEGAVPPGGGDTTAPFAPAEAQAVAAEMSDPFRGPETPGPGETAPFGDGYQPPAASDPFGESASEPAPAVDATVARDVPDDLLRAAAPPASSLPLSSQPTVVAPMDGSDLPGPGYGFEAQAPAEPQAPAEFPPPAELPAPAAEDAGASEEAHFQEVFQQFLATRGQCNEPLEGLTYEKFAAKLVKNRDQLIEKYGCKAVRFHVYVKEGKAALKATPVRE